MSLFFLYYRLIQAVGGGKQDAITEWDVTSELTQYSVLHVKDFTFSLILLRNSANHRTHSGCNQIL